MFVGMLSPFGVLVEAAVLQLVPFPHEVPLEAFQFRLGIVFRISKAVAGSLVPTRWSCPFSAAT